ncbi:hypothetical protein MXB_2068, partial [Myxobolus squamalis]
MIKQGFTSYKRTLPSHLEKYLTNFIREYYGEEILKQNVQAIKCLHNLRNEALCRCSEVSEKTLNLVSDHLYTPPAFLLYELYLKGRRSGDVDNKTDVKFFQLAMGCLEEMKNYSQRDNLSSIMFGLSIECSNIRINRLHCAIQLLLIPQLSDKTNHNNLLGIYTFILEKSRESLKIIDNSNNNLLKGIFARNIQKTEKFALVSMLEIQCYICPSRGNCDSCVANIR